MACAALLTTCFGGGAAHASLSQVELYTMGPGEHLFTRFGHAAICVTNPSRANDDRCYNYGTTNFQSPPQDIGWSLVRGTSVFWVSVSSLAPMLESYRREDRSIYRQVLPLPTAQVNALATQLAEDAREENRYYRYHHFSDNCSTRIRDQIDMVTGGALSAKATAPLGVSYRQLGMPGIADMPAAVVAAHLFVGRVADRDPTEYGGMFLPSHLRDSVHRHLGASPTLIYERQGPAVLAPRNNALWWLLLLAALVWAPLGVGWVLRRGQGAALSALLLGGLGVVVWLAAALSTIAELTINEALLVFWPADAVMPFLADRWRKRYAALRIVTLALVALGLTLGWLHQPLWAAMVIPFGPMVAALVCGRHRLDR